MGTRAWPRGGGLELARVWVSRVRVRASRVRVLAQKEAAQMAGTWPKSKGSTLLDADMVTQAKWGLGPGPWRMLGLARVRVSRVRARASRVRVLAQRETTQTAGTWPK